MKYKTRFSSAIFLGILLMVTVSCEEVIKYSDLEVNVSALLSGNPREDVKVTLYYSNDDANNETNPVTSSQYTNSDGNAYFTDLEYNIRYYIRADVILTYIKRTEMLKEGYNNFDIRVL